MGAAAELVELEDDEGKPVSRRARRIDRDELLHESVAVRMGDTLLEALEVYGQAIEADVGVRLSRADMIRQLLGAELERRLEARGLLELDSP